MIKFSLENLPVFLMPQMKNIGEKELFFGTPVQRISKNNGSTSLSKEKGSNAAITIRKRYTSTDPNNSGMPVALFLGRTETKREFHIQASNALIYYGIIMGGERSPTDWVDFFEEEKLDNYLLTTERKSDGQEIKGYAPQNKQQREEHLTEQMDSSLHDHDKIWFINILRDRLLFDIEERTLYDTAMSDGYSLMTLKAPYKKALQQTVQKTYLKKGRIL